MPIHVDVFHPSRLVIAVVRGAITAQEVREAVIKFLAGDIVHYRKIIDIASPDNPLDKAATEALANLVLAQPAKPRGPLAFVVSPGHAAENAETFARMTDGDRPVKVFHSLHAARKWLDENTRPGQ